MYYIPHVNGNSKADLIIIRSGKNIRLLTRSRIVMYTESSTIHTGDTTKISFTNTEKIAKKCYNFHKAMGTNTFGPSKSTETYHKIL